jgi:HB1, ASXL, restriction endonuclease HTH domain/Restriction endonuclease
MTFTEAAAEVLRLAGKPLHYKEITELAVEKNLLSHVGKSPEVTMGARLAALIKKEDKTQPIVRLKPGVFALREWEKKKAARGSAAAAAAAEDAAESAEAEADENAVAMDLEEAVTTRTPKAKRAAAVADPDDEPIVVSGEDALRANLAASGADLFDDEDDDDEPILSPSNDGASATATTDDVTDGARRRKRRRRRGRGRTNEDGTPFEGGEATTEGGEGEGNAIAATAPASGGREDRGGRPVVRERVQFAREDRGFERGPERGERFDNRGERGFGRDRGFDRDRDQDRAGAIPPANFDAHVTEGEELGGRELADLALSLLANYDRNAGPASLRTLAEALSRKGRLATDPQLATAQLAASLRADNLRRSASGQRARFRFSTGGRVITSEWILGADMIRLEQEALLAVERYRDASRRALLRRLQELPGHAFVELALIALEKAGLAQLRVLKRPGNMGGEMHFSAIHRTGADEIRTAVVLRKDGREIGRERVADLRGSLHHYGEATAGWLITTGQILSGAREESTVTSAAPVALYDGLSFCRLLEDHGVGVLRTHVSMAIPDIELFEILRGN